MPSVTCCFDELYANQCREPSLYVQSFWAKSACFQELLFMNLAKQLITEFPLPKSPSIA